MMSSHKVRVRVRVRSFHLILVRMSCVLSGLMPF